MRQIRELIRILVSNQPSDFSAFERSVYRKQELAFGGVSRMKYSLDKLGNLAKLPYNAPQARRFI